MKHELDKMMDLIKDYKTGYGGVTDSFMRKELEMFAKDYHSEQCNIADVSGSDFRFKSENDKNIIYDSISDKDICMWFDEDTRDWLLDILNRNPDSLPF